MGKKSDPSDLRAWVWNSRTRTRKPVGLLKPVHQANKPMTSYLSPTNLARLLTYIRPEPSPNPNLVLSSQQPYAGAVAQLLRTLALLASPPRPPRVCPASSSLQPARSPRAPPSWLRARTGHPALRARTSRPWCPRRHAVRCSTRLSRVTSPWLPSLVLVWLCCPRHHRVVLRPTFTRGVPSGRPPCAGRGTPSARPPPFYQRRHPQWCCRAWVTRGLPETQAGTGLGTKFCP